MITAHMDKHKDIKRYSRLTGLLQSRRLKVVERNYVVPFPKFVAYKY